ncbi:MAG: hypothetical protein Tsb0020_14700 [Haliangiales bacterium]
MRAHEPQFNDEPAARVFTKLGGLAPAISTKVRTGRVGDGQRELPAAVVDRMDEIWRREIAEPLGFQSYDALRAALGPLSSR